MLTPTLDDVQKRTGEGLRIPLRKKIPADLDTPVSAFLKLKNQGAVFLLESVEQGIQVGRYSFIGIAPYADISLEEGTVTIRKGSETTSEPVDLADPFSRIRQELATSSGISGEHLPGPFAGAVGYLGYDIVRYFERIPMPGGDGLGLPDYRFLFPATLAVFDHVKSEIELLTLPPPGTDMEATASCIRWKSCAASSAVDSGMITANSSPPTRHPTSTERIELRSRSATCASTASPARCPIRSLTALKSSRSRIRSASRRS